jgi:hypothetical protein
MPSSWITLEDACDLAENSGVGKSKIIQGLKDGDLLARASDLSRYSLLKAECSLIPPAPSSIILFVRGEITKISVTEHIAPLGPGEHPEEIGGDLYTIVRHDTKAEIWYAHQKVSGPPQAELDPHFWNVAYVNSTHSWAIADDLYSYTRRKASGILLDRSDLVRISPHFSAGSRSSKKGSLGRPTVTDYLSMSSSAGGPDIGENTFKDHIKPFYELLWPKS